MSTTTDLTTLKINYLTQAQYDAAVAGGTINEDEIYMTPAGDESGGKLQIKQASGSFVEVADCARLPVQSLIANITATQSGSGTPSASNIRAISGWDSVNVTRAGKNLLDYTGFVGGVITNTGTLSTANVPSVVINDGSVTFTTTQTWRGISSDYICVSDSKQYVFSFEGNITGVMWSWYRVDKTFISQQYQAISSLSEKTPPSGARYLRITPEVSAQGTYTISNIQLETGTSATAYEAFNGTTHTTSLPSTVYGGTYDVTNGMLTVTHGYIASYAGETLPSTWISDRNVYASGTSPSTGAQVVYELAAVQRHSLTAEDINMLLGTNNVWADSGDIELSYIAVN